MSLSPREVHFLRRLIAERAPTRSLGEASGFFARDHGIGQIRGASVAYETQDYVAAEHFLKNRGYPLEAPAPGLLRSQTPRGGSEKTGALAVSTDLVAVVPLHTELVVPAGTQFLAADWRKLPMDRFEVILEVENLQVLPSLAKFRWLESTYVRGRPCLAVFRGMPGVFNTAAAARLLSTSSKPVLGFYDFDPAGLGFAASQPRLEALCLPPWEPLETATRHWNRKHLYYDQLESRRAQLDALSNGPVHEAWRRLQEAQCGLDQEHFPQ